ncbi:hypothetical protein VTI74DRAFT_11646 [Chaetomium olivicolor]
MVSLSWLFSSASQRTADAQDKAPAPALPQPPTAAPVASPAPTPQVEPTPIPHQDQPPQSVDYRNHFFSQRSLRQLGLFFGGAGFFYWSLLVSRRAITRHQIAAQLKFYQPNQFGGRTARDMPKRDPLVAVEALNLATLNTLSFFVMAAGGVSWAFDISTMEDLRRLTRRSIEGVAGGKIDKAAEQEVAEWVAKTLGIEQGKEEQKGNGGRGGNGEEEGKR